MEEEKQDSADDLTSDMPKVEKIENSNEEVIIPKPVVTKNAQIKIGALVVFLIGVILAFGLLSNEADDELAIQEEAMSQTDEDAEANSLSLDDIQATVMQDSIVWSADLQTVLEAYDATNDNVSYVFGDANIEVSGNGLPDHSTGEFPNSNNPNSISEQDVSFSVPRAPVYSGTATDVRVFGFTLGGIKIEPGTAERDTETNTPIEAFNNGVFNPGVDDNNAHVQPNGTYHYHGLPSVLITAGEEHSNLIGFAADGFPIYGDHGYRDPTNADGPVDHMTASWRLKTGERPDGEPSGTYNGDYTTDFEYIADYGDLDECNGRFTITPEFPNGTYAYFITGTFPFFGRCVKGEVLDSFDTAPAGGAPQGLPPQGGPGNPPQ